MKRLAVASMMFLQQI